MLYREIINLCSVIHTELINTLCGLNLKVKLNRSHYRPEVPRGFQEIKVPRLRDNDPGWW